MKHALSCLLILTLVIPAEARERTPPEQAKKVKPGTWVVVTLQDNTTFISRLRQVMQDRLTLEQPDSRGWSSRDLSFQDVRKITVVKGNSTVEKVIDEVVMIPAACIFFSWYILSCGVFRHNCEGP
jgi:hypothetical protein